MEGGTRLTNPYSFCCGGKGCPSIRRDGASIVISDAQAEVPTLTVLAAASIRFEPEQAKELRRWLEEQGF